MKSKAPLVMMEQIVMVLVFALAATFCIQVFVVSEKLSQKNVATDRAILETQNVAEQLKKQGLNGYPIIDGVVQIAENSWKINYDSAWEITDETPAYYMVLVCDEENDLLWKAHITTYMEDGSNLFELSVAGQK